MEANIIYRIAKGDEQALDAFMDHYSDFLYRTAYGVTGDKETAEEVVSDVFLEVWKKRKTLLEIDSMSSYLRTLAYRMAISVNRYNTTRNFSELETEEIEMFQAHTLEAPDDEFISREEVEQINRAIEELPPKCRHVFTLAKLEDVSYNEISNLLNISVSTINYHVKFAMEALKMRLRWLRPPD